jgi:hypothetical protein
MVFTHSCTFLSLDFIHKGYEMSGLLFTFADGSGRIAHINSSFAVDLQPPLNILSLIIVDPRTLPNYNSFKSYFFLLRNKI